MDSAPAEGGGLSRRTFIMTSAGAATVVGVPAAVAIADKKHPVLTEPTAPPPREPVMALIRDEKRGEITVMSGTSEVTYRDPELVKRLMAIAPESTMEAGNVVTP
ncbi:MAG: hypothetical protein M3025_06065 [Actinomycetota bacterium]|jgi:hypothetical protein|nr:hypothetical protein [Actinomycetota bacterium]